MGSLSYGNNPGLKQRGPRKLYDLGPRGRANISRRIKDQMLTLSQSFQRGGYFIQPLAAQDSERRSGRSMTTFIPREKQRLPLHPA